MAPLTQQLFRRKPVPEMTAGTGEDSNSSELVCGIGLFQRSMFGIGSTIGTGIFFVLSQAVPEAGPAVIWSFLIAGVVAGLTAICYAELASAVPVSGSSYSYSYAYATLGDLPALGVAACLLLEYGVSAAAVATGWSQYLNKLVDNLFGFTIPEPVGRFAFLHPGTGLDPVHEVLARTE
jgi:amino acid transporter